MQPYTPQVPTGPDAFAGRQEMRDFVRSALEAARAKFSSSATATK